MDSENSTSLRRDSESKYISRPLQWKIYIYPQLRAWTWKIWTPLHWEYILCKVGGVSIFWYYIFLGVWNCKLFCSLIALGLWNLYRTCICALYSFQNLERLKYLCSEDITLYFSLHQTTKVMECSLRPLQISLTVYFKTFQVYLNSMQKSK